MSPVPSSSRLASCALAACLVATIALFGYTAAYEPSQRAALSAALIVAASVTAWFAGARAIRDPDPGRRLLAIAGSLLLAPFVLFALAPGFGPPHDQPVEQNALRFLLLAIDSILVGIGLCALREALLIAGERVQSTLGQALVLVATPLYVLFCLIQRNDYAAIELGWSWAESVSGHARELSPLDALSIPALFFAGACTWLAGAAFARGAGVAGLIGARTSTLLVLLCIVGLAFLIARGLAYPSLHGAMSHWFTTPGFVAGIPAVPWMAPGALGVLLLRRAGLSATAARE